MTDQASKHQFDALFSDPAPSTVLYRSSQSTRSTVTDLIDSKRLYAKEAHGVNVTPPDAENGVPPITEGDEENDDGTVPAGAGATKLSWQSGVLVPCLLNIWGVIMFLRLGWVVGQAGIVQGTLIILFSNVVTTVTALSLSAIATNGEVKGGGAYYLISRSLGPVFGGSIGLLFFVAQSIATSMYVVGFAESLIDLLKKNDFEPFTGDELNDLRVIGIITSVVLLCVALVGIGWYAKTQILLLFVLVVAMISVFVGAFLPDVPDTTKNTANGFIGFEFASDAQYEANYQYEVVTQSQQSFFSVFSVFFPAVTGIMAGANLSGDLEDASVAIPKGTLIAIVVTLISYIGLLWFVGLTSAPCSDDLDLNRCPMDANGQQIPLDAATAALMADNSSLVPQGGLLYNKLIMESISFYAPLVYVGVFAATLSSALASLVGGPRILQSVASDNLFPWEWLKFFAKGKGASNEPINAYFVTFIINCACVLIGKLDVIAPLISNFFMVTYALTNYACFAQSMSKSPGWRPSFKYYNKWVSLFGAILCIAIMGLMDPITFVITVVIALALMGYLSVLDVDVNWGPAGEARKYYTALTSLQTLQGVTRSHAKTFRPQYLVMAGEPGERQWLVKFVSMLQKGRGILVHADVVLTEEKKEDKPEEATSPKASNNDVDSTGEKDETEEEEFHTELALKITSDFELVRNRRVAAESYLNDSSVWNKRCPGAFADVVSANDVFEGFKHLVHTSGLGRMRPNTVVLGFKKDWVDPEKKEETRKYESLIRVALASNFGLMIVRDDKHLFDLNVQVNTKFEKFVGKSRANSANTAPETSFRRTTPAADLPNTLPGDVIDVWWVADDGGLTMLIPYLLQQSKNFKGKKLRVITVADYNNQESLRLQKTEFRMVHLLQKFRIEAEVMGVDANLDSLPSAGTLERLESKCNIKLDSMHGEYKKQTMRILRLSELLKQNSSDSAAVFMSLPIPVSGMPIRLFMSWLEMLTCDLPPSIMMRGNNENVLTFFC